MNADTVTVTIFWTNEKIDVWQHNMSLDEARTLAFKVESGQHEWINFKYSEAKQPYYRSGSSYRPRAIQHNLEYSVRADEIRAVKIEYAED